MEWSLGPSLCQNSVGCIVCCVEGMLVPTVYTLLIRFSSQFLVDQMNRDEHVRQLVLLLDGVFEFLTQASQLDTFTELTSHTASGNDHSGRFNVQTRILVLLSQQTAECGHFICDYTKDTSYCQLFLTYLWLVFLKCITLGRRTVKHTVSEADSKIKDYEETFAQLKSDFQNHAVLHTQITVLQVKFSTLSALDKLDDIGKCILFIIFTPMPCVFI